MATFIIHPKGKSSITCDMTLNGSSNIVVSTWDWKEEERAEILLSRDQGSIPRGVAYDLVDVPLSFVVYGTSPEGVAINARELMSAFSSAGGGTIEFLPLDYSDSIMHTYYHYLQSKPPKRRISADGKITPKDDNEFGAIYDFEVTIKSWATSDPDYANYDNVGSIGTISSNEYDAIAVATIDKDLMKGDIMYSMLEIIPSSASDTAYSRIHSVIVSISQTASWGDKVPYETLNENMFHIEYSPATSANIKSSKDLEIVYPCWVANRSNVTFAYRYAFPAGGGVFTPVVICRSQVANTFTVSATVYDESIGLLPAGKSLITSADHSVYILPEVRRPWIDTPEGRTAYDGDRYLYVTFDRINENEGDLDDVFMVDSVLLIPSDHFSTRFSGPNDSQIGYIGVSDHRGVVVDSMRNSHYIAERTDLVTAMNKMNSSGDAMSSAAIDDDSADFNVVLFFYGNEEAVGYPEVDDSYYGDDEVLGATHYFDVNLKLVYGTIYPFDEI